MGGHRRWEHSVHLQCLSRSPGCPPAPPASCLTLVTTRSSHGIAAIWELVCTLLGWHPSCMLRPPGAHPCVCICGGAGSCMTRGTRSASTASRDPSWRNRRSWLGKFRSSSPTSPICTVCKRWVTAGAGRQQQRTGARACAQAAPTAAPPCHLDGRCRRPRLGLRPPPRLLTWLLRPVAAGWRGAAAGLAGDAPRARQCTGSDRVRATELGVAASQVVGLASDCRPGAPPRRLTAAAA